MESPICREHDDSSVDLGLTNFETNAFYHCWGVVWENDTATIVIFRIMALENPICLILACLNMEFTPEKECELSGKNDGRIHWNCE